MEFFQGSSPYYHANNNQQFTPEKRLNESKTENFVVDDLLDFPTDELVGEEGGYVDDVVVDASTDSSTAIDSCNSSLAGDVGCKSFVDTQFSNICVPYDDFEFEWLSKFEEESFSSEEVQKLQLINGVNARSQHAPETHQFQSGSLNRTNNLMFNNDMTIPGKTRTKRSRVASSTWATRLLARSPNVAQPNVNMSSNSESCVVKKNVHALVKEEFHDNSSKNEDGRKCLHCATSKTPQWRSGPMGPKTLCNACGVRYKSGRLVPEYRPASSPTFVLTKHSNSHRKVIELRRQKEMQISQHHHQQQFSNHQNIMLRMPNGDDYLVHQHMSHDYRQLI